MSDNIKTNAGGPLNKRIELRCAVCGDESDDVYTTVSGLNRHCVGIHGKTYRAGGKYRDIPDNLKREYREKLKLAASHTRKPQGVVAGLYTPAWTGEIPLDPVSRPGPRGRSSTKRRECQLTATFTQRTSNSPPLESPRKWGRSSSIVEEKVGRTPEDPPFAICARLSVSRPLSPALGKPPSPVTSPSVGADPVSAVIAPLPFAPLGTQTTDPGSFGSSPSLDGLTEFETPFDADSLMAAIFPSLRDEDVTKAVMSPNFVDVAHVVNDLEFGFVCPHGREVLSERVRQARGVYLAANRSMADVCATETANSSSLVQVLINVQRYVDSLPLYE